MLVKRSVNTNHYDHERLFRDRRGLRRIFESELSLCSVICRGVHVARDGATIERGRAFDGMAIHRQCGGRL